MTSIGLTRTDRGYFKLEMGMSVGCYNSSKGDFLKSDDEFLKARVNDIRIKVMDINSKIEEVKKVLLDLGEVSLMKQCKGESIVYTFYSDSEKKKMTFRLKQHYRNEDWALVGECRKIEYGVFVEKFLENDVYGLISRGFELKL